MKHSPLRKVSKKMSSRLREYNKIRRIFLGLNTMCMACLWNRSSEIHHQKGRIGDLLCDHQFFFAVCIDCHSKIEKDRKWSMERGYSLDRLNK